MERLCAPPFRKKRTFIPAKEKGAKFVFASVDFFAFQQYRCSLAHERTLFHPPTLLSCVSLTAFESYVNSTCFSSPISKPKRGLAPNQIFPLFYLNYNTK